ncbi:GNAT family N-acetyltransferase [Caldibacillus lycopersici]|uniref:GNAT family N-acetyltransferase n=1 Tax=Perspicuibacillus lycopersici TaxID=1325689 RepID=A0AAE3LMW7_9BACI|nr:GNAT family N-acetyltransferase [Perspicuibacillus lycopersici]MCU9613361.1 GNAT family N-acetyltransferase [Perspicuibacillus lycopersici]
MKLKSVDRLKELEITLASENDAAQITELLKDTARWIQEKEIDQWRFLLNGGEDEEIKAAIKQEETFLITDKGNATATFTLYYTQNEWDQYVWGNHSNDAVYLHRLAVTRSLIGTNLGKDILHWVIQYLADKGKLYLRLDCVENNEKLNQFYQICGFEKVGSSHDHSLYEQPLQRKSFE